MQCDVTDLKGNHCPEEAVHTVIFKGVETYLCERCHANVLAGAYGRHLTLPAPDGGDSAPSQTLSTPDMFSAIEHEPTPAPRR